MCPLSSTQQLCNLYPVLYGGLSNLVNKWSVGQKSTKSEQGFWVNYLFETNYSHQYVACSL